MLNNRFYLKSLLFAGLALCPLLVHADKRITILNANFRKAGSGGSGVKDWALKVPKGTNVGRYTGPGFEVLVMFGTGGVAEQSFLRSEATADKYSTYYITFDAGWRNNAKKDQIFSFTFELVNTTDDKVLGKAVYVIPPNTPSNKYDSYRVASRGTTVKISYDNTPLDLRGDELALRITSRSTMESENVNVSHQLTGWLDNIYVRAAK